jgi:hypothetical protein
MRSTSNTLGIPFGDLLTVVVGVVLLVRRAP